MLAIGDGDGCDGGCSGSRAASVLYGNEPVEAATRYGSSAFENGLNLNQRRGQSASIVAPSSLCLNCQSIEPSFVWAAGGEATMTWAMMGAVDRHSSLPRTVQRRPRSVRHITQPKATTPAATAQSKGIPI